MREERLFLQLFDRSVSKRLYYLMLVARGRASMQSGLSDYLAVRYPGLIGFGVLSEAEAARPGWWDAHVRNQVGAVRARAGYFLFRGGIVVGHHQGNFVRSRVQFANDAVPDHVLEQVRKLGFAGSKRVGHGELLAAYKLIRYFDEILERQQRTSGFGAGDDGRSYGGGAGYTSTPGGAPSAAPPPSNSDPFEVLGVAADATTEQIRKAYKEQMRLNHPDKVAHLSPALQRFAGAQTVAINQAYEAIIGSRS